MLLGDVPGLDVVTTTGQFTALLTPDLWYGIDAVLCDLMLPEVSGADVLAYLTLEHPHIRRIAMTASVASAADAVGLADTTLVKPFGTDDVLELLGMKREQ